MSTRAEIGRCPGSGAIDGYLRELGRRNPGARDELRTAWADLKRRGAVSAAVAVYTARAVACDARLGAGDGPSTSSLVVAFQSEEAAAGAYRQGMLSFTTPGADEEVDGLVQGAATGLGRSAWIVQRQVNGRATLVAYWQRHTVAAMVIAVDEDPLHARQALTAVDGRIP